MCRIIFFQIVSHSIYSCLLAFFAAAGAKPPFGLAVTSLGSTVALKQLSSSYVEDATKGVYRWVISLSLSRSHFHLFSRFIY